MPLCHAIPILELEHGMDVAGDQDAPTACAIARGAPEPVSRWDLRAVAEGSLEKDLTGAITTILAELEGVPSRDGA